MDTTGNSEYYSDNAGFHKVKSFTKSRDSSGSTRSGRLTDQSKAGHSPFVAEPRRDLTLVRRYQQLLDEINRRQRFTKAEWTQKTIDALLGALTIIDKKDTARITYQEWRQWQGQLAKQSGWEEPEETETKPVAPRWKKNTA